MKADKTVFFCTECGNDTPKWSGRCSSCGAWNTLVEAPAETKAKTGSVRVSGFVPRGTPKKLSELTGDDETRFSTGIGELDRVLGGGAVYGSIVLVGGAPGIGKSTLLLQLCGMEKGGDEILYVTGEESTNQLKMRAERLGVQPDGLYILAETSIDETCEAVGSIKPKIVIVDSIQTMYNPELSSAPGSVGQVKDCTMTLMRMAKSLGVTVFVIGHVNKDGAIAGPKVLEHMVDCVLYFEGERATSYRILRAAKNRFGSTNELGVFEMHENGLIDVENPSEMLLSGRPENAPGTCVTCVIEGSRPILAEIQALVTPSGFNVARRNTNGIDYNRAMLLLAVLEKRGGISVSACDAYINVIGGLELDDPATDLATVLAIVSSGRDIPIGTQVAALGEVGLTGELRSVTELNKRLVEIGRLGFKRCIIPAHTKDDIRKVEGLEIVSVSYISEAIKVALG